MNKRKAFQRVTRSNSNSLTGKVSLKASLVGRFALLAFLVLGMLGGVAGQNVIEHSIVDVEGDGSIDDGQAAFGTESNDGYRVSLTVIPSKNVPVSELDVSIYETRGSDYGGEIVDIYIDEGDADSTKAEGSYVGSWDPDWSTGTQTIQLDSTYQMEKGNTYEIEFITTEYSSSDFNYLQLEYDDSSTGTNYYYLLTDDTSYSVSYSRYADVTLRGYNELPNFDSTLISPDPPLIGENVSYGLNASDSDGTVQSASLTVFKDGSQVYQDSQSFSSSSVSYTWSDVYVPSSSGDLDARFTVTDDAGAETVEWINRTLTESAPASPQINLPDGSEKNVQAIDYDVSTVDDGDNFQGESLNVVLKEDGNQVGSHTVTEGGSFSGSYTTTEGSHTFEAEVTENDGESSSSSVSYSVGFISPTVDSVGIDNSPLRVGESADVSVSASDNTDVSSIELKAYKDGSLVNSEIKYFSSSSVSTTFQDVISVDDEGSYEFEAVVTDNQGKIGTDSVSETVTDSSPSSPSISLPDGSEKNVGTVDYSVDTFDDGDDKLNEELSVVLYEDGSQVISHAVTEGESISGSYTTSGEGSHTFEAEVVETDDSQSNSGSVSYNVDFISPTVDSLSIDNSPIRAADSADVSVSASDNTEVSIIELEVYKDGSLENTVSKSFSSSSVSTTFQDVISVDKGSYEFKAVVTDNQGKTGTDSVSETVTDTAPSIQISSPSKGKLLGDSSVDYSFSTDTDDDDVLNENLSVDVLLDGSVKASYSITEGESKSGTISSVSDGGHTLTVEATENDGDTDSSQVSFEVDTTGPQISISAPQGTVYGYQGIDLNYSVSDPNLDSSSCEYSKDGEARISLSSCSNTEIQFGSVGRHNVTVYASDTLLNQGSAQQTFTLDNRNFVSAETASTGSTIQELDVTLEGLDSSKSYSTSSGEVNFTTLNAPRGEVEITVNSPGHVPTSETLSIDDSFSLDKTYQLTRAGISVSTRDELTGDLLGAEVRFSNGSETFTTKNRTDDSSFYYGGRDDRVDNWLYQGEIDINESFVSRIENDAEFDGETSWKIGLVYTDGSQVNKSLGTSTEVDSSKLLDKVRLWANEDEDGFTSRRENFLFVQPKEFSITYNQWQEQGLPTGSLEITVDKQGYKPRKYFGQLDSNSKLSLNAYLLAEGEGLPVSIQVYDSSGNSVENSNMTVQRDFGGSFRTVSSKKTLSSGANSFYLSPDISYKLLVNHPEYVAFSGSFSPLSYQYDPLKVYLGSASDYNFTTAWSGISYQINPESKTIGENASFNFTVIDSKASIEEFGLKVYNENNSLIKQESVTGSTSGGSVTLTENVSRNNNVTLEPYFYKNNELYTLEKNYIVREPYNTGRFSLSKMMDGLKKQSGGFAQGMISLVFALIAGLTVSRQFNSKGGGLAVLLVLGLFTVFGFINPVIYSLTLLAVLGALMM